MLMKHSTYIEPTMTLNKIPTGPMRINQSTIKRLHSAFVCPQRYYREEISGVDRRQASEAMIKGQYFEYKLFGTPPKEGGIPVIPPLKNGKPSTDQIRIDAQIERFPVIMEELGIKISKTNFLVEYPLFDVLFHGTNDVLVTYRNRPYIMDTKLTANCESTFGPFPWGRFTTPNRFDPRILETIWDPTDKDAMDLLQPYSYSYLMELLTQREWGFLYATFDYKPKSAHKIIEVLPSKEARWDVERRLKTTKSKLITMANMDYKAIPSSEGCKGCKFMECSVRYNPEDMMGPERPAAPVIGKVINEDPFDNGDPF